jgi:predicted nucleic acid-binding protein
MPYLIDTGVLLRAFDTTSPQQPAIRQALRVLIQRREDLFVSAQNMAEFWNVATRPLVNNGQGLSLPQAERRLRLVERFCLVISEDLASYEIWKSLLTKFGVSGVAVHDARLVATMIAHQIETIVTLNERDFRRYEPAGVLPVTPASVSANP